MKKIIATYSLKHLSATTIQKKTKKWIQQKHLNCDANYKSLAIFQFIETLLNGEKTVTIENGSPQVNGLKIANWIEVLSLSQEFSYAQITIQHYQKLIIEFLNLLQSDEEPYQSMRTLLTKSNSVFLKHLNQFTSSKDFEIEYYVIYGYQDPNYALRCPQEFYNELKTIESENHTIDKDDIISKIMALLFSFSFLINQYTITHSLSSHPPSSRTITLYRGINGIESSNDRVDNQCPTSFTSSQAVAREFQNNETMPGTVSLMREKQLLLTAVLKLNKSNVVGLNTSENEHLLPIGYRSNRSFLVPISTQNLRSETEKQVNIEIGRIPKQLVQHLKTKKYAINSREFFAFLSIANTFTLNRPYPDKTSNGNHNGLHSLRQLRLLNFLLSELTAEFKTIYTEMTDEETFALNCAAIFLRSGRINEENWESGDDYYTRSSIIFELYLNQCEIDKSIIQQMKLIISDSCKPLDKFSNPQLAIELTTNKKTQLLFHLLDITHHLDLVRLNYNLDLKIKVKMQKLFPNQTIETLFNHAIEYATQLLEITGSEYDEKKEEFKRKSACLLESIKETAELTPNITINNIKKYPISRPPLNKILIAVIKKNSLSSKI